MQYHQQYTGWHWRNFFIPIHTSCSGRRDVGQGNVNISQHIQWDRQSGASSKLFLSRPIQFYVNNVTNLQHLTSRSTTIMPYNMEMECRWKMEWYVNMQLWQWLWDWRFRLAPKQCASDIQPVNTAVYSRNADVPIH